jgi:hypothetical protein
MTTTITGGVSGSVAGVSSEAAEGLHTINKPQRMNNFYSVVLSTGTMTAGAQTLGELVQFRWVNPSNFFYLHEVQVLEFRNVATAWTAGRFLFDVCGARLWTVDGTGGTTPSMVRPMNMLRATMSPTSLSATGIRLATTAILGVGTKVLDTLPLGACYGLVSATATGITHHIPQGVVVTTAGPAAGPGITIFKPDVQSGEHPAVFAANEGFVIRATVPATGTWQASFLVKWSGTAIF